MSLLKQLQNDAMEAMKNKDKNKKDVLSLLRASIQNESIALKRELTDVEILDLIKRELKQTKEAREEFVKGNRSDLVQSSDAKIVILTGYLPSLVTEEEIRLAITSLGFGADANKGAVTGATMKLLKEKYANRTLDGKLVKAIVEAQFN